LWRYISIVSKGNKTCDVVIDRSFRVDIAVGRMVCINT
jgi:hypothetical protein